MSSKTIWIVRCKHGESGFRTTHYHRTFKGAEKRCLHIAQDYKRNPVPEWVQDEETSTYTWKLINLVFEVHQESLAD